MFHARPVWRVNEPKKTGARSAQARTRGQNPLVRKCLFSFFMCNQRRLYIHEAWLLCRLCKFEWDFAVLEFLNNLWGTRNRVGIGLSYRPTRLHSLVELLPWNRFLGCLKVYKFGLWKRGRRWRKRERIYTEENLVTHHPTIFVLKFLCF